MMLSHSHSAKTSLSFSPWERTGTKFHAFSSPVSQTPSLKTNSPQVQALAFEMGTSAAERQ